MTTWLLRPCAQEKSLFQLETRWVLVKSQVRKHTDLICTLWLNNKVPILCCFEKLNALFLKRRPVFTSCRHLYCCKSRWGAVCSETSQIGSHLLQKSEKQEGLSQTPEEHVLALPVSSFCHEGVCLHEGKITNQMRCVLQEVFSLMQIWLFSFLFPGIVRSRLSCSQTCGL